MGRACHVAKGGEEGGSAIKSGRSARADAALLAHACKQLPMALVRLAPYGTVGLVVVNIVVNIGGRERTVGWLLITLGGRQGTGEAAVLS